MRLILFAIASIVFSVAGSSRCEAQCFDWKPGFSVPGVHGAVVDQVVFDDGSGPALYVAGYLDSAEDVLVNGVARWNGQHWSAVGSGSPLNGYVNAKALAVYDDGGGPALYAALTQPGLPTANRLVRWNGSDWAPVAQTTYDVTDLCVYDDGSGPALYIAMRYSSTYGDLQRWDGTNLTSVSLPAGLVYVNCLCVFDDGSGPALCAAGGAGPSFYVSSWNGTQWTQFGASFTGSANTLCVYDSGSGPELVAGGLFSAIGGVTIKSIARWTGVQWAELGGPVLDGNANGEVKALTSFDPGTGPQLYACGTFTSVAGQATQGVARWDGNAWWPLSSGLPPYGFNQSFGQYDAGAGLQLYVGGSLVAAGGLAAAGIARWDGANWSAVASSIPHLGLSGAVWALTKFDDGTGPALYAGGDFACAGGTIAPEAAKLTPAGWQALGAGPLAGVRALCGFDDGTGPKLYAGLTNNPGIRRWDGNSWTAVGPAINGAMNAFAVFDDGSGQALYAGGYNVRRWNGTTWTTIGGNMNDEVLALTVHDDGTGPALYAAGRFTIAGGVAVNRIAKWNGTNWSPLGSGLGTTAMSQRVTTMVTWPSPGGTVLVAGGIFSPAPGNTSFNMAAWNGTSWSPLSTGEYIEKLHVFDDGTGPALYGGLLYKSKPMRWTGATWAPIDGAAPLDGVVHTLATFDDGSGSGPDLYCGGGGFLEGGPISLGVSVWRGCAGPGRMFCFGDHSNGPCPCNNAGTYGRGCANSELSTGAILSSSGATVPDTIVLAAEGVKSGVLCAFLQGTVSGAPLVFGDGLRCTGGSLHRLYIKPATGNSVAAPQGAEPSITSRSAVLGDTIAPGSLRYYQVYYRDGVASFCPSPSGSNWNVTGAVEIQW